MNREPDRSVCFCNSNRAWGGGEQWHLNAALGLAKRGCRVFVMAGKDTPLFERVRQHPEITLCPARFSNLSFLNPLLIQACAVYFMRNRISRVVLGLPSDLKAAGLAARRAKVPGIYYRRGIAVPVKNTFLNRIAYGNFLTGLIVNSKETARLVFADNDAIMDKRKVHVMPNGLDIPAFDAAYAAAAPVFRHDGDTLVIGNAGRLTEQKGQHFLLHMSRALLDAGVRHRLIIAGDGEKKDDLARLAAELHLGDAVHFTGFLADMAPFWRSIDMFALSSLWEGFGFVLAEAQLAAKPVLAFDGNSMPEVVSHGETGLLLPLPERGESPAAVGERLAAAVRELAADPARAAALAAKGRAHCRATYDLEKRMDDLYALLWPEGAHAAS
ncbi:Glycosyl transferase group 1 [uncultured delta proteobacterium]|uniref:Glycosyl transferase group 1 n=1 Tax=uncultured delta proteobacterium TaxID=34034 RepID=A0A212JJE6_9DELT|nr:Glycosyl transferase group 1 [uncultured delta proteobacterium]